MGEKPAADNENNVKTVTFTEDEIRVLKTMLTHHIDVNLQEPEAVALLSGIKKKLGV